MLNKTFKTIYQLSCFIWDTMYIFFPEQLKKGQNEWTKTKKLDFPKFYDPTGLVTPLMFSF